MPDFQNRLVSLMRLLDDESPVVQEAVTRELNRFGHLLEEEIQHLPQSPSPAERKILQDRLEARNRQKLSDRWSNWFYIKDDYQRLEKALSLISDYQTGILLPYRLETLLDELADEYLRLNAKTDIYKLSVFLFRIKRIEGARRDYHNPYNSSLVYVIKEKKGIPITMAALYMLVGRRLGLKIEGCNYPGHFLAKAYLKDQQFYVDCYNGGRLLSDDDVVKWDSPQVLKNTLRMKTSTEVIVIRVLNNLYKAYQNAGHEENALMVHRLRWILEKRHKSLVL